MRYGYFDDENREYVIEKVDLPTSWTNYLGLENMCSVMSQNAGGYSFYKSAQFGRITRFRANAVPIDRPGHYVYIRDDDSKDYWSISWQPVGKDLKKAKYQCRHGLSYSKYACSYKGIEAEKTLFIPQGDDVELWDVKIKNTTKKTRNISLFSYVEFSLHKIDLDNQDFQMGLYASGASCKDSVIEYDFFYGPDTYHYMASSFDADSFDCTRDEFIGTYNTETNPQAVINGRCSNSQQTTGNHCGSLHKAFKIEPGEEIRIIFMLGVGDRKVGKRIRKKYSNLTNIDKAFEKLAQYWDNKISVYNCQTPDAAMNSMVNIWNLYQAETCVVWSRFASFIEVGGRTGLGYRDTAQDVMSVVHTNPEKAKWRMRQLLRGQCSAGFGIHLFDPADLNDGDDSSKLSIPTIVHNPTGGLQIPTLDHVCSDDVLWLVVSVCEYIKETGDVEFFDEVLPYADKGEATVYTHLKKTLDFSAKHVGATGICKGLRADWNDCINLGGGETAMVSFMHHWALNAFIEAASFLGKQADVRKYTKMADTVKAACDKHLWDGKWYIRGITAKGKKLGTNKDKEGKLFLNAQSWAVMSGVASGKKAQSAMDAVEKHLYSDYGLHLSWPAFATPNDSVGFVTRVYKGVKENASIFSHPNPWAFIAECILGNGDRAFKYYSALCPYKQNDKADIRIAEPYSYCQFAMGKDHAKHGQARHPWLSGSAGWAYTAATRWMLGIRTSFDGLIIDPCIPSAWPGFTVTRKFKGATYNIAVSNSNHVQKGVKSIMLNGQPIEGPIPPQKKGTVNDVKVLMG
ncbi:MAG: N,N'-diacetylchitobiose phosphorylase [Phycisphaerae bacterium]|nr:N,N'-diacetylchitobiose phosphorylase [Phycisphaerae bacterium]